MREAREPPDFKFRVKVGTDAGVLEVDLDCHHREAGLGEVRGKVAESSAAGQFPVLSDVALG